MADFEHDDRVIIYPAYLNKNKSVREGRRITKQQGMSILHTARIDNPPPPLLPPSPSPSPFLPPFPNTTACNNPLTPEIYDCATKGLNLKAEPEGKTYPRDWQYRGRVRVQLRNEDGSPANPSIPTSKLVVSFPFSLHDDLSPFLFLYTNSSNATTYNTSTLTINNNYRKRIND